MNDKTKEALKKIIIRIGISGHYDSFVQNRVEDKAKLTLEEVDLLKKDKDCLSGIDEIRQHRWEGYKKACNEILGEDDGFHDDSLGSPEDFIDMIYTIEGKKE